jgi:hypothetical protein
VPGESIRRKEPYVDTGVPAPVQKAEEYRRHAEECRMLAGRSRAPEERDMLLNMANTWDSLAKGCEAQIAQQERMKGIASGPGREDQIDQASIPIDKLNASNDE